MVYRYTGIAAAAILAFALSQLNGLLRSTVNGPPWQVVVLAGLALGVVITWTGLSYRLSMWWIAGINIVAYVVVAFRIATPETLIFLIPTGESFSAMGSQLDQAMAIIRNGIEPVIPVSGLVVILTGVLWAVGVVTAYGLLRGRPGLAVVPGLVMALQFATMDRNPTGMGRVVVFLALLAGAVLAVTWDERAITSGRMAHASGWKPPARVPGTATIAALVVTIVGSTIAVGAFRNSVPYDGVVAWRAATGLTGEYFGSISYNPFTRIQQAVVQNSTTPLFYARVRGDIPADRVYFRLLTLETYAGGQFFADRPEVDPLDSETWELDGHAFAGPTASISTDIVIDRLDMDWLPAAYVPTLVQGDDALTGTLRVRPDDGALRLDGGRSYPDLVYSVQSEVPQPDLESLASTSDGELSPLFEAAAEDDAPVPSPEDVTLRDLPPDSETYLQLPEDLDPEIVALAAERTANLTTPFEIGFALESWFRSDAFRYTTDIEPGHGVEDLQTWLLDTEAEYFRSGYCENFATAMAVLARTRGVPSRVVLGFTPGERTVDDDIVVVRDRNAHAWVELWMPAQGWVRFDPTPRADRINPATTADVSEELGFDLAAYLEQVPEPIFAFQDVPPRFFDPADILDENFDLDPSAFDVPVGGGSGGFLPDGAARVVGIILLAAIAVGTIPLLKWWRHRRRMDRLRHGDITAAWEDIVAMLEDYGDSPPSALTPDELAGRVDPAMAPLATVYGRTVYGPPAPADDTQVATATRSLEQTSDRLAGRYSRTQRLAALYRPGSLIPQRWRRSVRRRAD
jgi:hypothetical protein